MNEVLTWNPQGRDIRSSSAEGEARELFGEELARDGVWGLRLGKRKKLFCLVRFWPASATEGGERDATEDARDIVDWLGPGEGWG